MPAYVHHRSATPPRDRALAIAAVLAVQLMLGAVLLSGLRVKLGGSPDEVERLITVALRTPDPPAPTPVRRKLAIREAPAPKAISSASPPERAQEPPPVTPVISLPASAAPSTGAGTETAAGSSTGGGAGEGHGGGGGGTELLQIAGEIRPSDYPRKLREAGIGGRVGLLFTVGIDGRVTHCRVTNSSGVPQLDALTCRLIQERFRYRPSTDSSGRPMADVVEGDHEWIPRAR